MGAVQGGTRVGNGLNDDAQRGACSGRKRRRALPGNQAERRRQYPSDECSDSRPARGPSDHPAERRAHRRRLSTEPVQERPLDGLGPPARERRINGEAGEAVRPSDRAFHRRGRRRPGSVNAPGAGRTTRGLPTDRPNGDQLVGRRRLPRRGSRDRTAQTDPVRLWTEMCMAFTALDAMREGYEVYPVVDAIGGTSPEAHRAGLDRVIQAGGQPVSWVSLAVELQRDWARQDTVQAVIEIVLTDRLA